MPKLVRGGTVVTDSWSGAADLLLEQGRIAAVARPGTLPAVGAEEIDASGLLVLPGGVDVHTHLDMPLGELRSADDFDSGTRAAALGGTTCIVDYAAPEPDQSMDRALSLWRERAAAACVDFGLHMTVSHWQTDTLEQMARMVQAGVPTFKVFTDYPGRFQLDDGTILRCLCWAREHGALILVHAVNGSATQVLVDRAAARGELTPEHHGLCRPTLLEGEATARVLALAEVADAPIYIVHLTCGEALQAVRRARRRGVRVLAETCPQYLTLSQEKLALPDFEGAKYVCNPPLRPPEHAPQLWQALAAGELQTVATDHCPFNFASDRQRGRHDFRAIPNGLPGIETRLPLMMQAVTDGRLQREQVVGLCCSAPARLMGLHPRKGTIAAGSDADLVLWDPAARTDLCHAALHMRVDYSLYEGQQLQGGVDRVLLRGEVVVHEGRFVGRPGGGEFIPRTL